jgi:tetratricopeptide (TPR) repeat protein
VTATHGFYLDQGLEAYRAGHFELAEKYYQNAYRMRAEPGLSDANDLALVWLKLGKTAAAKALLGKHLGTDAPVVQRAAAYFNLGLIEERLGNRDAALRHYRHADEIESTPARRSKLRELSSPAAFSR